MKLFYKAGASALAPHIVMSELNMVYEVEAVDLQTKTGASGDFWKINPKGSIPALIMDNGEVLTESAIICQYLADEALESNLLPKFGTIGRLRCLEWMHFIATEIHKNFSPLFSLDRMMKGPEGKAELKTYTHEVLKAKLTFVSEKLASQDYLLGTEFSIADAYLFNCLVWGKFVGVDLAAWPNLASYTKRIAGRTAVIKAMKEEGLL